MKKKNLLYIVVIASVGLITLVWFKHNLLIDGGDFDFPLSPLNIFNRYYQLWDYRINTGQPGIRNIPQLFPYQLFLVLTRLIGISLITSQKILFYLIFTSFGLSMYYLVTTLTKNRIVALAAAFFYMLNPFARIFIWHQLFLNFFLYAFFPLMLAFYIRGLKERSFRYIFGFCLVSLLVNPTFANPTFIAVLWFPLLLYLLYYISIHRRDKNEIFQATRFTAFILGFWVIINLWWLLLFVGSVAQEFGRASQEVIGFTNIDVLRQNSLDSGFLTVFRLLGHWAINCEHMGDHYYSWAQIYTSNFFIFLSFLTPFLGFSLLVFKRTQRDPVLYFALLSLIGLWLVKGAHSPFGGSYVWAFGKFPLLGAFRNHYEKLGILVVLGYSFLIGGALNSIYSYLRARWKASKVVAVSVLALLFVLLFGVNEWPFWRGEVISSGGRFLVSMHIKIPEYYWKTGYWLKGEREDFRILSLPRTSLYGIRLAWESGYSGADLTWHLLDKPIIFSDIGNDVSKRVYDSLDKNSSDHIKDIVRLLNVGYVLVHNDIDQEYTNLDLEKLRETLEQQEGIYLDKRFGKLDFYKISDEYFLPHIYACP